MSQATVVRILAIENEATKIRDEATAQAAQLLADFEREAAASRDQVLSEARAEARRIQQEAKRTSEARQAKVIAQAELDAREMEERAAHRVGAAVQYILDQITERT